MIKFITRILIFQFIISTSLVGQSTVEPSSITIGIDAIGSVSNDTLLHWGKTRAAFRGGQFQAADITSNNTGQDSFAYGDGNTAEGIGSFAMGLACHAQQDYSIAMGSGSTADGAGAITLGTQNQALFAEAIAIGNKNVSNTRGSIALGSDLIVNNLNTVAVGVFNVDITPRSNFELNPIFVVGNGDGRDIGRSNAMTVLFNGRMGLRTTLPQSDLHLVHNDVSAHAGLRLENDDSGRWWRFFTNSGNNKLELYNNVSSATAVGEFNTTGIYSVPSDRRLKKDIIDLPYGLKEVLVLSPKRYQFKHVEDRLDIGLIAQDVIEIIPELVSYDEKDDKYMMNYDGFSILAIKGIQELHDIVIKQQNQIDILTKELRRFNSEAHDNTKE